MRFPHRRTTAGPAGVTLKVHSHRDPATLFDRNLEGALVVIDHRDLDAETAHRLAAQKPHAVLNAAEFISGRFANLGPRILAEHGILLLEADRARSLGIADGSTLRLDGDTLYNGAVVALDVHRVSAEQVEQRMNAAAAGLVAQLESFAHTTSEFLRREDALLLHGHGAPELSTTMRGKAVLVLGPTTRPGDLRPLRAFCRDLKPVVIAIDGGAEAALGRRLRPDVVILSGAGTIQPKTLARCREVVLTGPGEAVRRRAEQARVPVLEVHNGMAPFDLGLLVAYRSSARLVVPVGYPWNLEDFVDRDRNAQASNVLTRLRVGSQLVEATAIPLLYTGKVRRWEVALTLVVAAAVLATAIALTPVGQDWWQQLRAHLPGVLGR